MPIILTGKSMREECLKRWRKLAGSGSYQGSEYEEKKAAYQREKDELIKEIMENIDRYNSSVCLIYRFVSKIYLYDEEEKIR